MLPPTLNLLTASQKYHCATIYRFILQVSFVTQVALLPKTLILILEKGARRIKLLSSELKKYFQ